MARDSRIGQEYRSSAGKPLGQDDNVSESACHGGEPRCMKSGRASISTKTAA